MGVLILQWTDFGQSYRKCLSDVEVTTTHTDTQIWHYAFSGAPCKTIFCDYGWGWQFRITCKHCNGFVTCSFSSVELIYITFIHAGISTIGIHPGEVVPEILLL